MGALFLSALLALNATTPLHSMVSRIARLRAWQVGASRAASVARRPPRTLLALAPDSHQQQRIPAIQGMRQCLPTSHLLPQEAAMQQTRQISPTPKMLGTSRTLVASRLWV